MSKVVRGHKFTVVLSKEVKATALFVKELFHVTHLLIGIGGIPVGHEVADIHPFSPTANACLRLSRHPLNHS